MFGRKNETQAETLITAATAAAAANQDYSPESVRLLDQAARLTKNPDTLTRIANLNRDLNGQL